MIGQAAVLIWRLTLSRRIAELLLAVIVLAGCSRPIDSSAILSDDPAADALPNPTEPLLLLETIEVDARIRELRFYSPALAAETRVRVLLPVGYDAGRAASYPVTYLLHGCCSNGSGYRNWTEDLGLTEIAQSLDQVFVMPEGGNGGLYSDWYNAGAGGPPRWESYHIRELLPWMEKRYRLRRDRRGRSLLGISMGGHGAFAYAAKYPQYFGSAAALSPAIDSNTLLGRTVLDDGAVLDGGVEDAIWGPRASEELRWRGHNPVDLAENLHGVDLFIRSGNGRRAGELLFLDIFEAAVHEMSVNMSKALQAHGIAYRFDDYGFGTHTPEFWREGLRLLLLPEMLRLMQQPAIPIRAFSYRSIDPSFEVHGWKVSFTRDAPEFARLGEVSEAGFSLSGSGVARVLTARWFRPDQPYSVQIDGHREVLTSNAEGRLDITVDLGPARRVQEYRFGSSRGFLRVVTVSLAPVEK